MLISYIDTDERYAFVNRTCADWYQRSPADLIGKRVDDMLGASFETIKSEMARALAGVPVQFEKSITYGDGETRDVRGHYLPHRDEDGAVLGFFSLVEDITDIRRAHAELDQTSGLLRTVLDSIDQGLIAFDSELRVTLWNERVRDFYHYPQGMPVVGTPFRDLIRHSAGQGVYGPGAPDEIAARFDAQAKVDRHYQSQRRLPNGRIVDLRRNPLPEGGFVTTYTDITEQQIIRGALAESEERFRSVVDHSPTTLMLKDVDGRIRLVNHCYEEWFGKRAADVIGKTSADLYDPDIARRMAASDRHIVESRQPFDEEIDISFADGAVHQLHVTKFPVFGPDGDITGVGAIGIDMTGQRQAEERLRQSQKLEAVGQLTGGVAHDFNNLLTAIIGNLDLLGDFIDGAEEAEALRETAMRAAQRGATLNRQLLAFSRKQVLDPRPADLNALINKTSELLYRTIGAHIQVKTLLSAGLWPCAIDEAQLESAILNLAINARDAMPDGGTLTIETANVEFGANDIGDKLDLAPGRYVMVVVSDNGEGIAEDIQSKVFDPFFTTKEVGKGSGLGLSMVYGFVKQSGGEAKLHSEKDRGTTVTLYFPAVDATGEAEDKTAARRPTGGSETILLVEDEPDVRDFLTTALRKLGYTVHAAAHGPAAIALMDEGAPFDLLLTDVVLPHGLSGRDVADAFAKRYPAAKVLFTSGYTQNAVLSQGDFGDGVELLPKPYTRDVLADRVRAILG